LTALHDSAAKKTSATKKPAARIKRDSENPKIIEFPGSEGDRNIALSMKMEQSATMNE
jgi:hypothetical protein